MAHDLVLKGALHGVEKVVPYKDPDILYSIVDNIKYPQNKIRLSYVANKPGFYIYHMYDNREIKYSGRWYDLSFKFEPENLKDMMLTVHLKQIAWRDFETDLDTVKDVDIVVFFTKKGFRKLKKYIANVPV